VKPCKQFALTATQLVHNHSLHFLRGNQSWPAKALASTRTSHQSRTAAGSQRPWAGCDCPDRSNIASVKPPLLIRPLFVRSGSRRIRQIARANVFSTRHIHMQGPPRLDLMAKRTVADKRVSDDLPVPLQTSVPRVREIGSEVPHLLRHSEARRTHGTAIATNRHCAWSHPPPPNRTKRALTHGSLGTPTRCHAHHCAAEADGTRAGP